MKKPFLLLALGVAVAACRESNMAARSTPSAPASAARVMRFDTTFLRTAQRTRAYHYTTALQVGRNDKTTTIPVEIAWTATQVRGCPQVASVQVYQLGGDDRRAAISASVKRDSTCRAGLGADGKLGTATTGMALVSLAGVAREVRYTTVTSCLINGLGYHDSLNYDNAAARR